MSKVMQDAGHRVHLYTNMDFFFKQGTNKESTMVRIVKESLAGMELFFRVLFSNKDLYYFSSPPFLTCIAGILACVIKRKKYIFDIRDVYPQVVFHQNVLKEDSALGRFFMWLAALAYKHALVVITVTEGFKQIILDTYAGANVQLIYNGYDPELFKPSSDKFENYTVVFHGNLGKFQRIDLVRQAAERLEKEHSEIKFVVIGEGPGDKHLENLPSNLEYLGPMDYQKLASFIAKCHLGVSFRTDDPTSQSAFPVKVFEYIGVGIPVVISPPGEASTFIKANNLGLEVENDLDQIVAAILECKDRAFRVSAEQFSRQSQCQKIISIISYT